MFYTRIPCPKNLDYSPENLNKATRYFPIIGWLVGAASFIVFYIFQFVAPTELAVLLSLVTGILITGAFHEDGLADFFDGFGGGWSKEKILDIMKDSRVGTYGMVATILSLAIKYFCLVHLVELIGIDHIALLSLIFIAYHSLARFTAIQICFLLDYVRDDEKSKAKPIAKKQTHWEKIGVYTFGLIPLLVLCFYKQEWLLTLLPLYGLVFYFKYYLNKWIGGYTGDCLGALEQLAESVTLISFIVLWNCIL